MSDIEESLPDLPGDPFVDEFTERLMAALEEADVLDSFLRMEPSDQAHFLKVIGSTDDPAVRSQRTATFISALHMSPRPGSHEGPPSL